MYKKQFMALAMLIITALPLFVSLGIVIMQQALQFERNERFEEESLHTITMSPAKLHWIKPGKEVLADGRLFDVESYKVSGNVVELTGFYDHEEEKLVEHILNIHQHKKDSKGPVNYIAIKFLFYPRDKEAGNFIIQRSWQIVTHDYPVYTEATHWLNYPAPTPPPKYC